MTSNNESGATPAVAKPSLSEKLGRFLPNKTEAMVGAIALLAMSNAAQWVELHKKSDQRIVTVSIRDLTNKYVAKLATNPDIKPAEVAIRADVMLAVSADAAKRFADKEGALVVARECVVAGEKDDITPLMEAAVDAAMAKLTPTKTAQIGGGAS